MPTRSVPHRCDTPSYGPEPLGTSSPLCYPWIEMGVSVEDLCTTPHFTCGEICGYHHNHPQQSPITRQYIPPWPGDKPPQQSHRRVAHRRVALRVRRIRRSTTNRHAPPRPPQHYEPASTPPRPPQHYEPARTPTRRCSDRIERAHTARPGHLWFKLSRDGVARDGVAWGGVS